MFKTIFFTPRPFGRAALERTFIFRDAPGTQLLSPILAAHRGEFSAALQAEYPVSAAVRVEADPVLAESLKGRFDDQAHVNCPRRRKSREHNRIYALNRTRASSIFGQRVGAYGVLNRVKVPTVDFAEALRRLGGHVDLAKLDIAGAEVEVMQTAHSSDLTACSQLTVEFSR